MEVLQTQIKIEFVGIQKVKLRRASVVIVVWKVFDEGIISTPSPGSFHSKDCDCLDQITCVYCIIFVIKGINPHTPDQGSNNMSANGFIFIQCGAGWEY